MKLKVPSEDQEKLLTEMGIDPKQYGVHLEIEGHLYLKHYKTGNEISIRKNVRCGIDHR